jgi:hypothetical protein
MKDPTINIVSKASDTVQREIYEVQFNKETYTYMDYIQEGSIVDSIVRDVYGNNIDNPEILHELTLFFLEQK